MVVLGQGREHPYLQCHAVEIAKTLASAAAGEILVNHLESLKSSLGLAACLYPVNTPEQKHATPRRTQTAAATVSGF